MIKKLPNIALSANKQSGKTTLANVLVEEYGYRKLSFASPVYQLSEIILDTLESELHRAYSKDVLTVVQREDLSICLLALEKMQLPESKYLRRGLLQGVGDGARVSISNIIWIEKLLRDALDSKASSVPVVVDDCRYLNEMLALTKSNFQLLYIHRKNSDGIHPSEQVAGNIAKLKDQYGLAPMLTLEYSSGERNVIQTLKDHLNNIS